MPERILAYDVLDTVGARRLSQPQPELRERDDLDASVIPKWTVQEIPQRTLLPLNDDVEPIVVDRILPNVTVSPDSNAAILWFAPTSLILTNFTLTVRRQVRPDGGIAVTGGSVILSVSLYLKRTFRDRSVPAAVRKLLRKGRPVPLVDDLQNYSILPAPQYGLTVVLQLPAGVAAADPIITVSPLAGAATIAVDLTEAGVLAWRSALEQRSGDTIPGTLRATASIPTVSRDNWFPGVETRVLDTPLGTLLAGRGADDIREIDPQQTVSATVVVVGSQLVTTSTVALHPSGDQAPTSAVFGPTGGRTDVTVVTQQPETLTVDWRADVAFAPPRWPVVPAAGRLDAASGWITIVKPESWCVGYLLVVVPVDAAGRPVPAATRVGDRVQGVINFTAPYIAGGLLSTAFEAEYGRPTSLVLPRYPDRPFGDLVLTVFATCGGRVGQASRKLGPADVVVTALAYPDGRVELHIDTDSLPEASSGLTALLARLGALANRSDG